MLNTGQRDLYEGCGDADQATPACWRSGRPVARHSFDDGKLLWGDTDGLSSVADAERLLCLLYPATEVPAFRLDQPDTTERDVLRALDRIGSRLEIPPNLITALTQFMRTHTGTDDSPTFSGGHYFRPAEPDGRITHEQGQLGVVDPTPCPSPLCLATLGFLKVYEGTTTRPEVRKAIGELREATNARLTAAMVSLLRLLHRERLRRRVRAGQAADPGRRTGQTVRPGRPPAVLPQVTPPARHHHREPQPRHRGRRGHPRREPALRVRLGLGRRPGRPGDQRPERPGPRPARRHRRPAALRVLHRRRPRRHPGPLLRPHPHPRPARRRPAETRRGTAPALGTQPAVLVRDRPLRHRTLAPGGPALADHRPASGVRVLLPDRRGHPRPRPGPPEGDRRRPHPHRRHHGAARRPRPGHQPDDQGRPHHPAAQPRRHHAARRVRSAPAGSSCGG